MRVRIFRRVLGQGEAGAGKPGDTVFLALEVPDDPRYSSQPRNWTEVAESELTAIVRDAILQTRTPRW